MKTENLDSNVHLRMQSAKLAMIDRAAETLGINRSQFMTKAALEEAANILQDTSRILADNKTFDAIFEWLDSPKSERELAGIRRLKETELPW